MKPIECAKCHKHWNPKFNRQCPRCGAKQVVRQTEDAPSPEQLQRLQERFG